jgi:hypothetical protein
MKKLLVAAAAASALFAFTSPASASPDVSQFCKTLNLPGYSHGDCTSILSAYLNKGKGNNDVAAVCKDIKNGDPVFFDAAFGNVGQCIKQLADFFPG